MRKLTFALISSALILTGAGCLNFGGSNVQITPVTLEYWRMDDAPEVMSAAIEAYKKIHPNVDIKVRSFRSDKFEQSLLEALAEDRGPDMFSIPNVWLRGWKSKLLPMPLTTTIPTQVVDPNKKTIVAVNQQNKTLTKLALTNQFVEAVADDVMMYYTPEKQGETAGDRIWGLPYSLDTLALFYNADLLRKTNIETPPKTWRELQDQATRLTLKKSDGTIEQSGAAIGTAKNVRYATDILTAIMMQNGAQMADSGGTATFNMRTSSESTYPPGIEALMFYQNFALPNSSSYTWSSALPDSLDAFIAGRTAFYFGFPYDQTDIRERAPRLNLKVTDLPQVNASRIRNVAHYQLEVVSKKTTHPNETWDFIQFASGADQVRGYLNATNRPTALRALISEQITNPTISPFVSQVLTARSWYRGSDWNAVESAFAEMIETYPTELQPSYNPILQIGINGVNATLR